MRVRLREDVSKVDARALEIELDRVEWGQLSDAYGAATAVPVLLYAVTLGDATTRRAAWWELWGNVHHQGTVYSATVPAIEFIASVAKTHHHPDRIQALSFMRAVALGDGENAAGVRAAVQQHVQALIAGLAQEPELVQRAVAWLATAYPSLVDQDERLVALVPTSMRPTWEEVVERTRARGESAADDVVNDDAYDREDELERWMLAGWSEGG